MGQVFRAVHLSLKREVALKVMKGFHTGDRGFAARFQREIEALGRLDHPNVVRATDAGEVDGVLFLVMEYLDGLDLGKLVARSGPLPPADACELIRQAAAGLDYIHRRGLVHRDLKPSNLLLDGRRRRQGARPGTGPAPRRRGGAAHVERRGDGDV